MVYVTFPCASAKRQPTPARHLNRVQTNTTELTQLSEGLAFCFHSIFYFFKVWHQQVVGLGTLIILVILVELFKNFVHTMAQHMNHRIHHRVQEIIVTP